MTDLIRLLIWLAVFSGVAIVFGLIADRTNIGAGLAAAVKGRPYQPTNPGETR